MKEAMEVKKLLVEGGGEGGTGEGSTKEVQEIEMGEGEEAVEIEVEKIKKKRGRPPKVLTVEEVAAKAIPKPVGRLKKVLTEAEVQASLVVKMKGRPKNVVEDTEVEPLKEKSEKVKGKEKESTVTGDKWHVGRPAYTEEHREAAGAKKAEVEVDAQRVRDLAAETECLRKKTVADEIKKGWVEAA